MSDIDSIKSRIRKLMAVAGDGVASDGEIDNAMNLAAKLLDAHHLSADDVADQSWEDDTAMGQGWATSQSTRFSTWESSLARAISDLFGCVDHYLTPWTTPLRVHGVAVMDGEKVRMGKKLRFYGPAAESVEAAELFNEWSRSIATMAVARWGGCFRGDGAAYACGFALALKNKAFKINQERQLVQAKPLPQIASASTAITLSERYGLLRDAGRDWLKKEKRIDLHKRSASVGYGATGGDAYKEGRDHGSKAEFGRNAKRRMLPG